MTTGSTKETSHIKGIVLMVAGMFLFTINDAIGKWLVVNYSVAQVIAVRSAAALVVLAPVLWVMGKLDTLFPIKRPWVQLLRVILVVAEVSCFYWAVRYLPLADVFLIYMASPIFVTVLSVILLGERVGIWRWIAVVSGFAGVLLIFPPSSAALTIPAIVALIGSIALASIMVLTRYLRGVSGYALITYQTMAVALAGGAVLPTVWITPGPLDLALLGLLGLVATMAHFLINSAVSVAPASVIAPYQYTSIIWAMILGFLVWGDVPSIQAMCGAALVIGAGLFILHRERSSTSSDS